MFYEKICHVDKEIFYHSPKWEKTAVLSWEK